MAAEFDGGVVIGADSRSTTGYFWFTILFFLWFNFLIFRTYISNRLADKLTKITDSIYVCRSGSAADTQAIADIVAYHLNFHT